MTMKRLSLALTGLFVLLSFSPTAAQDFPDRFSKLQNDSDTLGMETLLDQWQQEKPGDPEWYVSAVNFYFTKALQESMVVSTVPLAGDCITFYDSVSSQPSGYLCQVISYNEELIDTMFKIIDEGITLFPDRLDMRFGKTYILGQTGDYKAFRDEIIRTVDRSAVNGNKWYWMRQEAVEDAENFMLESIQDYQLDLFNAEDDTLLGYSRDISLAILTHYPSHLVSLSNLSIYYLFTDDPETALFYMKKANKLDRKDCVVLSNIAYAYSNLGEFKKSVRYYKKVIKYGDEEFAADAQDRIAEIKAFLASQE